MFSFLNRLRKAKPIQPEGEQEFTFIWYKKMVTSKVTHYTAPFRTKVKAKTRAQAVDKLTDFALSKMTLCIFEEKDFDGSDIMKLSKTYDELSKQMEEALNKIKTT